MYTAQSARINRGGVKPRGPHVLRAHSFKVRLIDIIFGENYGLS